MKKIGEDVWRVREEEKPHREEKKNFSFRDVVVVQNDAAEQFRNRKEPVPLSTQRKMESAKHPAQNTRKASTEGVRNWSAMNFMVCESFAEDSSGTGRLIPAFGLLKTYWEGFNDFSQVVSRYRGGFV